jgi:hypothetical protein
LGPELGGLEGSILTGKEAERGDGEIGVKADTERARECPFVCTPFEGGDMWNDVRTGESVPRPGGLCSVGRLLCALGTLTLPARCMFPPGADASLVRGGR